MKYDENNIFAKIIRNELPADKVYEDNKILAFYDKYPIADVHILVIPKSKYISFQDFIINAPKDEISNFFLKVAYIANIQGLDNVGYKIITNNGIGAGQVVFHFHVHIISEKVKNEKK